MRPWNLSMIMDKVAAWSNSLQKPRSNSVRCSCQKPRARGNSEIEPKWKDNTFRQCGHFPALQTEAGKHGQPGQNVHDGADVHLRAASQAEVLQPSQLPDDAFGNKWSESQQYKRHLVKVREIGKQKTIPHKARDWDSEVRESKGLLEAAPC